MIGKNFGIARLNNEFSQAILYEFQSTAKFDDNSNNVLQCVSHMNLKHNTHATWKQRVGQPFNANVMFTIATHKAWPKYTDLQQQV